MDALDCKRRLGLDLTKIFILTVGNTQYLNENGKKIDVKGHGIFYEAASRLAASRDDLLFGIVGDVDAHEVKVPKEMVSRFKLFGRKPHGELPVWLNACDFFVMPSLHEGVPTVLFEAMACGKPLIVTDVGGMPEIVNDARLGRIIKPARSDDLAEIITSLTSSHFDATHIASTASAYSWHKLAGQILSQYACAGGH